jgi:signal recognition particle receptor subunit alpha
MIDLFAVISLGGLVHWTFVSHKFDHFSLINSVLNHLSREDSNLNDGKFELTVGNISTKWFINEELGLIYVLAHPKMFPIEWTGSLFKRIDNLIVKEYAETFKKDQFIEFDNETFTLKLKEVIKKEELKSKETKKTTAVNLAVNKKPQINSSSCGRNWNDKVNKSDLVSLDYSEKSDSQPVPTNLLVLDERSKVDELSENESDSEESKPSVGTWWNSLKGLIGNNPLTIQDLQPALKEMKLHLISKNVASEPAEFVVKSVGNRLEGQIPGTFSSISRMVRVATKETLQKILTPSRPIDLLHEIKSRSRDRPFVMTFIGVNGVGKSTNLSKVAYWLLQHEFRVLLVAGDTFRAGAIEQLRHHCKNLGSIAPGRIEIYERGYGKDAALIAQDAIKYAKEKIFDIVLVDTAGRMQDNGPLMIALAKLVNLNRPDRVIFVGEALVGHDALSQLQKFNAALFDHSAKPIDGILLTKVDTIDDKIGAALSMTLTAKAPILFMGVGQTYTDLKRINIKQVVDLLLK